jgi:hypothetical protein
MQTYSPFAQRIYAYSPFATETYSPFAIETYSPFAIETYSPFAQRVWPINAQPANFRARNVPVPNGSVHNGSGRWQRTPGLWPTPSLCAVLSLYERNVR